MVELTEAEIKDVIEDCVSTGDDSDEIESQLAVARALKNMGEKFKNNKMLSEELVIKQLKEEMARLRPQARRLLYGEK